MGRRLGGLSPPYCVYLMHLPTSCCFSNRARGAARWHLRRVDGRFFYRSRVILLKRYRWFYNYGRGRRGYSHCRWRSKRAGKKPEHLFVLACSTARRLLHSAKRWRCSGLSWAAPPSLIYSVAKALLPGPLRSRVAATQHLGRGRAGRNSRGAGTAV